MNGGAKILKDSNASVSPILSSIVGLKMENLINRSKPDNNDFYSQIHEFENN